MSTTTERHSRYADDDRLSDGDLAAVIDEAFGAFDGHVIRSSIAVLRRQDREQGRAEGEQAATRRIVKWLRTCRPITDAPHLAGKFAHARDLADAIEAGAHERGER